MSHRYTFFLTPGRVYTFFLTPSHAYRFFLTPNLSIQTICDEFFFQTAYWDLKEIRNINRIHKYSREYKLKTNVL